MALSSFSKQDKPDNARLVRELEQAFTRVEDAIAGDAAGMVKGHTEAEYALTGWGASPVVAPAEGTNDSRGRVTFTSGVGVAANPTVLVTWRDPPRDVAFVVCSRGNMVAMVSGSGEWRCTAVTQKDATFTLVGQPTASVDYVLDFRAE